MAKVVPQKGLPVSRVKQSRFEHLPRCPFRSILASPSQGGKTVLAASMILDHYRGCFEQIHYWSQSADLDPALKQIAKYAHDELGQENCLHSEWNEDEIKELMLKQRKVISAARDRDDGEFLPQQLWVIDDYADNARTARGPLLASLYTRGRHLLINIVTCSQRLRLLSPTIRVNCSFIIVFRIKSFQDLHSIIEESSALVDPKLLRKLYDYATSEPYSFLYLNLAAQTLQDMFYRNFEAKLIPR